MKNKFCFNYIFIAITLLISCTQPKETRPTLNIAAAANMQFAIAEIAKQFSEKTGINCQLIISSSGKLTAQIREGAPYDVLLAANKKYTEKVYHSGLAITQPTTYAYGKLVLWSMSEQLEPSMDLLQNKHIKHIALANPKTAPYGVAATEALHHFNIYKQINNKLVFGESIAQTNQFIVSQAADIGFTALSVVSSPKMQGKGQWIAIDTTTYTPIEQSIVVVKSDSIRQKAALQFYEFIFSEEARKILKQFGYTVEIRDSLTSVL